MVSVPHVTHVDHGPPVTLTVRTLPGQLPGDYEEHAGRIAASLGVVRIRVVPVARATLQIELLETDPLRETIEVPRQGLTDPRSDLLLLGVDDVGNRYRTAPIDLVHLAIQGATGSGKSIFIYGLIAQLVRCPHVLIGGCDPTGLLLRPFKGTVHQEWQASGTAAPAAHVHLLERLVAEMDRRIANLPPRRDQVDITAACPLIFFVLEEYPGLLRAADAGKRSSSLAERIKLLVGRLIAEGRKAGIRLVILAQRFEAAIVDGYTRDQCTVRLSFRVGNASSIEMLHPDGRDVADEHAIAPPGVALLSAPGVPLVRIKSPYLGHDDEDSAYGRYWDLVTGHAACLPATRQ
jgi:S-DNA-T family DNA segregation ATPase FtsK/SpoIIIE